MEQAGRIEAQEAVYNYHFQRQEGVSGNTVEPAAPIPSPNRARTLSIQQLDHGYLVNVGCQSIAIESKKLVANLAAYLNDPGAIEKKFMAGELLK